MMTFLWNDTSPQGKGPAVPPHIAAHLHSSTLQMWHSPRAWRGWRNSPGQAEPWTCDKAGGWVPSDSYFLSELRFLQPLSPRPLSCLGHVATVLSLPLEWLGLGSEGGFLLLKSVALIPTPASRGLAWHCPSLSHFAETLRISILSFPGSR